MPGHVEQPHHVLGVERGRIGRDDAEDVAHGLGHEVHVAGVLVVGVGVALGEAGDVAQCLIMVAVAIEIIAAVQRGRQGAFQGQDRQAVGRQVEIADDLRPEEADDIGEDGEFKAGEDLLGDGCATHQIALFQDQCLFAGAGQVGGGHKPVVPAAYDDGVVVSIH